MSYPEEFQPVKYYPRISTSRNMKFWKSCQFFWIHIFRAFSLNLLRHDEVWWSSTFRCLIWLPSNTKCDSESCYIRHDEDTSHSQRPEATTRGALWKKEFLEISQNSQEKVCVPSSFLIKLLASGLQLYWKRDSGTDIFLWILRTPFLQYTPGRLLLNVNLIQGFWLYLKIPFLVKTKVKLGQMNWWTKPD